MILRKENLARYAVTFLLLAVLVSAQSTSQQQVGITPTTNPCLIQNPSTEGNVVDINPLLGQPCTTSSSGNGTTIINQTIYVNGTTDSLWTNTSSYLTIKDGYPKATNITRTYINDSSYTDKEIKQEVTGEVLEISWH